MKNLSNFLRLAALVIVTGIAMTGHAQTNYYSKSTGNLNLTSSWSTSASGTGGTAPTSFTANNQIFNIRNNAAPTINANWTVSGGGSYIVVGDGTNACNFQIPTNYYCKGTIDVSANATLTIANTKIPTLQTLNITSTVIFDGTNSQTIPAVTYGNLTYSGSATGTMAGACTIGGTLNVTNGNFNLNNSNSNYTFSVGSFLASTSQNVYFGGVNNYTGGTTMNISGDMAETGYQSINVDGSAPTPNGTINFTAGTHNVQASGALWINFYVLSGSVVNFSNPFLFAGTNIAGEDYPASFTVNSGGTLNCGTYDMSIASGYDQGNFILSSGATLITANPAGIASAGATGSIQAEARTFSSGANYEYDGTAAQNTGVFTTTPTTATVNNLTIDNTSTTGVTLSQAESVAGVLTLTDGLLNTTSANLITVNNGGSTTGASSSSFVNGPISKIGDQAFTFPVGASGTGYIPIGISAPSAVTDVFLAQYNRSSGAALGPITATDLNHVSSCDYWTLNHTTGSSAVNVTGYWNANSSCGGTYVNDLATIALAHFSVSLGNWNAFGNDVISGAAASGSVTWNNVSNFSPFALSSTSIFDPLPVTLVDFNAIWQTGGTVGLTWEIQEGVNTNHFDIQRSTDGVNWQTIGTLDAGGSSSMAADYSYTDDAPLPGQDYYRLQLVDDAGNDTYSTVRVLSRPAGMGITIFPNPATDHINVSFGASGVSGSVGASGALGSPGTGGSEGPASIRLMNVTGQVLLQESVSQPAGQTITLPVAGYPSGSYLVQVLAAGKVKQSGIVLIIR